MSLSHNLLTDALGCWCRACALRRHRKGHPRMYRRPHSVKLWPVTLVIISASVAAACSSDALLLYTAEPVPFTVLEGRWETGSGFSSRQRIVVRTPEHLVTVWEQLEALLPQKTSPPAVDFERNIVLVAAEGAGRGGRRIQIASVFEQDDELIAVVLYSTSPSGCYVGVVSTPATVVVVPRTSSKVSFVEREDHKC